VHPARPEKYEVPSSPRHVVSADAPDVEEAAKARRAKRSRRLRLKRRLTLSEWIGLGASCAACALLLPALLHTESTMLHQRAQVREKEAQFNVLNRQKIEEKNRLAHLKSDAGRDQLLAERGYVAPDTRILLFPEDQKEDQKTVVPAP